MSLWGHICKGKKAGASVNFGHMSIFFWGGGGVIRIITYLCPPIIWGGGDIVFSADPVGVSVTSCLHSIFLLNGQILAKLTQIYHWEGEKC